ncbi:hypothetical protein OG897_40735 [Streptomyces sp. NBC_00237]|nr:hypothetical protein [Streptomyces sp. NBC_00237]
MAESAGLKTRAAYVHLAHLVAHRRIEDDRRTPVQNAAVTPVQNTPREEIITPLEWVLTVATRDKTCRRMLIVAAQNADRSWSGQVGIPVFAQSIGRSESTTRVHYKHLQEDGLIRIQRNPIYNAEGDRRGRSADTYILKSGLVGGMMPRRGTSYDEDYAYYTLSLVPWWPQQMSEPDERRAVRLLRRLMEDGGWPQAVLLKRLNITPFGPVRSAYNLLRSRLPDPDEPYVLTAQEVVTGVSSDGGPLPTCPNPECRTPYPRHVYAAGTPCPQCGTPREATVVVPRKISLSAPKF